MNLTQRNQSVLFHQMCLKVNKSVFLFNICLLYLLKETMTLHLWRRPCLCPEVWWRWCRRVSGSLGRAVVVRWGVTWAGVFPAGCYAPPAQVEPATLWRPPPHRPTGGRTSSSSGAVARRDSGPSAGPHLHTFYLTHKPNWFDRWLIVSISPAYMHTNVPRSRSSRQRTPQPRSSVWKTWSRTRTPLWTRRFWQWARSQSHHGPHSYNLKHNKTEWTSTEFLFNFNDLMYWNLVWSSLYRKTAKNTLILLLLWEDLLVFFISVVINWIFLLFG